MSDVSTDSQIEFEVHIKSHNEMQDAISDGEWADADVASPLPPPPPTVAAVAMTGASTDHGYAAPMPGTVHTVDAELHAHPAQIAGVAPIAGLTGGNAGGSNTSSLNAALTAGAATSATAGPTVGTSPAA